MGDMMLVTAENGSTFILRNDGTWTSVEASENRQFSAELGFRKVPWGSSKSTIRASEEQPWTDSANMLAFDTSIGGMPSRALFILIDDQLVRSKYLITETYANDNKYLVSCSALKALLIKKYGTPDKDNEFWSDDLYQDDPDQWGMAVGRGDLKKYTIWETHETTVLLALTGENYDITLQVEYSARAFSDLEDSRTEARHLEDL
ncbi:hypothetical protein [Cryobacterium sp. TMT1-66-1]|uniref:hypothetical protein n=1 Tax=Cryobacterium sp. TMT1-66-1 TaxID=1259242 RepID=UPI001103C859|nr:hypothetical protein [Cryobacterium sp. TMT1-66-1]TFD05524.1 hypothetical protein E3T29_12725 [Cryobacterium sp. TMT1-66-1]